MINKVILVGRLGKNPEIRSIDGGRKVANFTLATTEKYTDKNGTRQEITEWHNIAVWGSQADIAEKYLQKGSLIYAEGKLKSRSWEDKDGNKKYATDVVLDSFKMLESKRDGDNSGMPSSPASKDNSTDTYNDDLPF